MAFRILDACNGCGYCVQWCPTKAIQGRRKKVHAIILNCCIDCGACGRICGQHAVVDEQGRIQERMRLSEWPKPVWDYGKCTGCGDCIVICPTHSLSCSAGINPLNQACEPYLSNGKTCVSCGFCKSACAVGAIEMVN